MKTNIAKLILTVILLIACSLVSSAQVGTITVKWNDDCYPPTNNTDYYKVSLTVYRNLDGAYLCGLNMDTYQEPYNSTNHIWSLETCYCTDAIGGYHIIATVKRYDQNNILVCEGITEEDKSCANLTDLEVKVEMPS